MLTLPSSMFRANDIRGKVATALTPENARLIAKALASHFLQPGQSAALGRDARTHSPEIADAVAEGLREHGVNVWDFGLITTPMLYFAAWHHKAQAGIMVTGSHNPIDENGLKLVIDNQAAQSAQIQIIREVAQNKAWAPRAEMRGHKTEIDIFEDYARAMEQSLTLQPSEKVIVVDAGNGAAGPSVVVLLKRFGVAHIPLYCEPDGRFPNHHPDPGKPENLRDLKEAVLQHKARFGIALDGDGDRLGVVDERGNSIEADRLLVLLAKQLLKTYPGATVIGDVKCSDSTFEAIKRYGGQPLMWKTGHSFIKTKMRESGALLAGEMSGHYFFGEPWIGVDDAMRAALCLCALTDGDDLAPHMKDIPQGFSTPEIRWPCSDDKKFDLVEAVSAHYQKTHSVSTLDGVRLSFDGGWALLRASNTEPVIVMRVEAESDEQCQKWLKEFQQTILHFAKALNIDLAR